MIRYFCLLLNSKKARTLIERAIVDGSDRVGNSDACQVGAITESHPSDGFHLIGDALVGDTRRDGDVAAIVVEVGVLVGHFDSVGSGDVVVNAVNHEFIVLLDVVKIVPRCRALITAFRAERNGECRVGIGISIKVVGVG